jgi:Skp family chaperone for outer membrane proteins
MNRYYFSSALAALAFATPAAVQAQPLPAPVIAVVNLDQIFGTCTQCAAANTQLQAQGSALQTRAQTLANQIDAEARAIQPLVNAIPAGGQPDAALAARIQGFQQMQQNADREVSAERERIQRNIAFVRQQIGTRIQPAITTVMQQRGATVVMDRAGLITASPTLDITPAVLAIVNQNNTPLNINAPPPQQPAAAPTPAQPQPNRPRPQGR